MQTDSRFQWDVPVSYEVFPHLAGISLREFHLNPSACAESFRAGGRKIKELFGADIHIPTCYCPPLAYGHVACLGSPVAFPENGAPAVKPILASAGNGIHLVKRHGAFPDNPLFREYLKMRDALRREFPSETVAFTGFGMEGPITTAVLLRGQDFFIDLYDCPEATKKFLCLLTESIIEFVYFCREINDLPRRSNSGCLCDDFAALIPPHLWSEFVFPYWEQYYRGVTTGIRNLHCEDLSPQHLRFFKDLQIASFDPDKSSKLTPRIISREIDIPFAWSLQSFDYPRMSHEQIVDWVQDAKRDGASRVYSYIYVNMCEGKLPMKVRTFVNACKKETS